MKVTLLYYDIVLEEETQLNMLSNKKTIKDKVCEFIETSNDEDYLYRNNNYIISILEIDSNFIFGTYGRIEDFSEKKLVKLRSHETLKEGDISSIKGFIERYTIFYYDIEKNTCIILHNPNVYGFKTNFSNFLVHHFKLSMIYKNINVVNRISNDIKQRIGKLEKFQKITYTYTSDNLPDNEYIGIRKIANIQKNQIKTANVELYLEAESDYTKSAEMLSNVDTYIDKFDTFKIHTETVTVDVVEKILSKKIDIELDEDDLESMDIIKEKLIENIDKY